MQGLDHLSLPPASKAIPAPTSPAKPAPNSMAFQDTLVDNDHSEELRSPASSHMSCGTEYYERSAAHESAHEAPAPATNNPENGPSSLKAQDPWINM